MKRLHVHVSVDDLAQSIRFYSTLFAERLDEGDVEEGGTGGGARTKDLAEKIAALREKRGRYGAMDG